MYIAHYTAIDLSKELYSSVRKTLDFPTQITKNGTVYSLMSTHIADTPNKIKNIYSRASELGIEIDVKID